MRTIDTTVEIKAAPDTVWGQLMSFETYPEWNPYVRKLEGEVTPGSQITVELARANGKSATFKPSVTALDPPRRFSWLGHLGVPGLFDGEHIFELTEWENGTVLRHHEEFRGVLAPLILRMIGDETRQSFQRFNTAIKERAEQA